MSEDYKVYSFAFFIILLVFALFYTMVKVAPEKYMDSVKGCVSDCMSILVNYTNVVHIDCQTKYDMTKWCFETCMNIYGR